MSRRDWAALLVVAGVTTAAISVVQLIIGQSLTVDSDRQIIKPRGSVWVWPTPDARGRMVLGDMVTESPAPAVVAAYPATDALERAERGGWGHPASETRVTLRVATFLDEYQGQLVWLIEYSNVTMILSGPPGLSEQDRAATLKSGVCESVVVMAASVNSGTFRYDRQYNVLTELQVCWPIGADLVGGYR